MTSVLLLFFIKLWEMCPILQVPSSDLFEIRTLPNLGNGLDINYILDRDGCYLGLIQRKVYIFFLFKVF